MMRRFLTCSRSSSSTAVAVAVLLMLSFDAAAGNNNQPILVGSSMTGLSNNMNASDYFASLADEDRGTYVDWLKSTAAVYNKHAFLPMVTDRSNGAAVLWKLSSEKSDDTTAVGRSDNAEYSHIQVAVAVRATGWVGFGISEAGGMLGSDIALWESGNPDTIRDSYVVEDFDVPKLDDCQSWTLNNHIMENGWIIVEMTRLLDTMDTQDHKLIDDSRLPTPTRLIAAWGDSPTVSFHGFQVGKISATIFPLPEIVDEAETAVDVTFARDFEEVMEEQADGYFEILSDNYTIPAQETTYRYVCKSFDELQALYNLPQTEDGILTFIGGGAVLSPETQPYVHHFIGTYRSCICFAFRNYG
jgi:DOMON domain